MLDAVPGAVRLVLASPVTDAGAIARLELGREFPLPPSGLYRAWATDVPFASICIKNETRSRFLDDA